MKAMAPPKPPTVWTAANSRAIAKLEAMAAVVVLEFTGIKDPANTYFIEVGGRLRRARLYLCVVLVGWRACVFCGAVGQPEARVHHVCKRTGGTLLPVYCC